MRKPIKDAFKTTGMLILIYFAIGGFISFLEDMENRDPMTLRLFGVRKQYAAYKKIPATPTLNKKMVINRLRIVVKGGQEYFDHKKAREWDGDILGYAATYRYKGRLRHYIGMVGKEVNGQIYINSEALGHELAHILNNLNKNFINPDELEKEGL